MKRIALFFCFIFSFAAHANNIIVNVGRAIGGFSSVVIGILMDRYNLGVVMGFLSALYIISFIVMITLPGLKDLSKVTK